MNVLWKCSVIKLFQRGNYYFAKGILEAYLDNQRHVIPFGASDRNVNVAFEKALSELCERATWFLLYQFDPIAFYSTEGFSAHIEPTAAAINSLHECYERSLFYRIIESAKKEHGVYSFLESFDYQKNTLQHFIQFTQKIPEIDGYISFVFRKRCVDGNMVVSIGMGKSTELGNAIEASLQEEILVFSALTSGHKPQDNTCINMAAGDLIYFRKLSEDKDIIEMVDWFMQRDDRKAVANCIEIHTYQYNVTQYCPDVFQALKRTVYFTTQTSIKCWP